LFTPLADTDEQAARGEMLDALRTDPESYLLRYAQRFGNVLNADDAATLFQKYNQDRMKYREAVHPAATWIRDELFRRALAEKAPEGRNGVVFTAGSNAAGKSSAISATNAAKSAQAVLDSTLSNPEHATRLVEQARDAGKTVGILYVNRPLLQTFEGMLERAAIEGRVVTIDQLIDSHRGAAETVRLLWRDFGRDPAFAFIFVDNSAASPREGTIELAEPQDYTEIRERLHELLDAEYHADRITEAAYRRVRGRERGQPSAHARDGETGGRGSSETEPGETRPQEQTSGLRSAAPSAQPPTVPPSRKPLRGSQPNKRRTRRTC